MADPKSKVQEAIEKLTRLKGHIDAEITRYNVAKDNVDDNYRVKDNQKEMNAARQEIQNQVARIDAIILDNPEIASLIGAVGYGEVESLNITISAVLAKVQELKSMEIKDKTGKKLEFKTDTEGVVTEVGKIENVTGDVDYENLDVKIAELEDKIEKQEFYEKYEATKTALGSDEVDKDYDDFNKNFAKALKEYKNLETLKAFPAEDLRGKAKGKHTILKCETDVKKLLGVLKSVKGATKVTIPGFNGGKEIEISKITFEDLSKASNTTIVNAMDKLISEAKVEDTDLENKAAEMSTLLSGNTTMQNLFPADRDAIQDILDKKPVNVAKLETLLAEMTKADGKNYKVFEDMETYDSIGDVSALKRELTRLKGLEGYVKAEADAKAVKHDAEEISKVEIAGEVIDLHRGSYSRDFVDIRKKSELDTVMEATYKELSAETYDSLVEQVENDAKMTGDKLPGKFFSGLMSFVTFGNYNPRRTAIEARVKNMISASILKARDKSKNIAEGKQLTADKDASQKTAEREKMTDFDKRLRVTENDLAREAMRKDIIAGRGAVTADKAKSKLNLEQISDDAKKQIEDEER